MTNDVTINLWGNKLHTHSNFTIALTETTGILSCIRTKKTLGWYQNIISRNILYYIVCWNFLSSFSYFYLAYMTWDAIHNNPRLISRNISCYIYKTVSVYWTIRRPFHCNTCVWLHWGKLWSRERFVKFILCIVDAPAHKFENIHIIHNMIVIW